MRKSAQLILLMIFRIRPLAGFAFAPSAARFAVVRGASRYSRSFSQLAIEPIAAGSQASATAGASAVPPTAKRIQGTGGLRQLPKIEPANELVSRAKKRVRVLLLIVPHIKTLRLRLQS